MLVRGGACIGTPWIVSMAVVLEAGWRWIATSCWMTNVAAALAFTSVRLRLGSQPLPLQLRPTAALLVITWVAATLAAAPRGTT